MGEQRFSRLQWIFRILLTVKLFISCDGNYEETSDTSRHLEPAHYGKYGRYVPDQETWVTTNIEVDCWEVDLPLTWTKKENENHYDCGDCRQTLTIFSSNISVVPSSAFREFSSITILRIDNVHVEILQPGSFNSLHSLKRLYLTDNDLLVIIPGIFNSLVNLEILDLSRNLIREISAQSLTGMLHLKQLNLSFKSHNYFRKFYCGPEHCSTRKY
ncbi:hypothetical protein JTB14_018701 [Gonioctena quinquepunctata]|nr:hypothetical protein JTB14_018701 [Gonioctena quinquepunctata]